MSKAVGRERNGKKCRLRLSTKRYKNKGLNLLRWREKLKEGDKRNETDGNISSANTGIENEVSIQHLAKTEEGGSSASTSERLEECSDTRNEVSGTSADDSKVSSCQADDEQVSSCRADDEENDDDVSPFTYLQCEITSGDNTSAALVESCVDQGPSMKTEEPTNQEELGACLEDEIHVQEVAAGLTDLGQDKAIEVAVDKAEEVITALNEQFVCPKCKKFKVGEEMISAPASFQCKCSTPKRRKPKKTTYKCDECDKVYDYPSHLERHVLTHLEVKPFACSKCERTFCRYNEMVNHFQTHSKKRSKPFVCTICKKCFHQKLNLDRHTKTHSKVKPFKCNDCGLYFTTKKKLLIHLRIHFGVKPFSCVECGLSFARKPQLLKHIQRHSGDKPHSCQDCGKSFFDAPSFNRHVQTRACAEVFNCADCNQTFPKKIGLINHLRSHAEKTVLNCDQCGRSFTRKSRLIDHLRSHLEEKPFSCTICSRSFARKRNLNQHIIRLH